MSKAPGENTGSSFSRRSGLPRLTSNFPSVLSPRPHAADPISPSASFISHPSPLSRFQPLALKRVFSGPSNKERNQEPSRNVSCSSRTPKPSCSSWIPSFHSKGTSPEWERKSQDDFDYREAWSVETSTFSKQLAKITRGSNEDIWMSCRPCLSVPRPAWPADGSHSYTEHRRITKECIGRKVVVAGKEEGILRYFGRTAFSSGYWCGIELETAVGKNDGSVDGVIYFSCSPGHGIFAPDSKVSLLGHPDIELSMKSSKYGSSSSSNSSSSTLYRLSTGSSSSSSSGLSGNSNDSIRSSGASSATYTIIGRENDSLPSTPNDCTSGSFKDFTICETEAESDPISPETGTCDDSSLGILTPDQMADFTITASASFERSPSDENLAQLEDEVCDDYGAVGGKIDRWDSQGSISGIEEEIIKRDISVIIRELKKKENDNSSSSASSSHTTQYEEIRSDKIQSQTESAPPPLQIKSKSLEEDANILLEKVHNTTKDQPYQSEKLTPSHKPLTTKPSSEKLVVGKMAKGENESDMTEWQSGVSNMTTSAASLDQGYQGDGEFDVPSEAGSATASSPTEDPHIFEGVIDIERISLDPNSSAATEADVSLADDETESENGVIPRDRTARIIDGKLYHSHRELVALRQAEGRHEAHASEMDSSGFYSDLDPREEESIRMEAPVLQPLKESKLDATDSNDSVLDDTTQAEEMEEYATSATSATSVTSPISATSATSPTSATSTGTSDKELLNKEKNLNNEDSSLIDEDDKSSTCTVRSELKDISTSDNIPCVPSDSSISYNDHKVPSPSNENTKDKLEDTQNKLPENENEISADKQSTESCNTKETPKTASNDESNAKNEPEYPAVQPKPRNYDKPWLSKPLTPRRVEKPKVVLPPPPPMPKKNVQSKLKALLEASEPNSEDRKPRQPKKGRWDEVMSRIEEGKKEEKVRPKVKEVKSRLLDALKTPQPVSPQVERIRQERRERRERRERQAAANAATRRMTERKRSVASSRPSRAPSLDSIGGVPHSIDSRASTPEVSQHSTSSSSAASGGLPGTPGVRTPARERIIRPLPSRAVSRLSTSSNTTATPDINEEKKRHDLSLSAAAGRRSKIDTGKTPSVPKNSRAGALRTKQTDPVKVLRPTTQNGGPAPHLQLPPHVSDQLKRLEAELSARTQEAQVAREETARTNRGLEALTVLVHYLTEEYDAFSTPKFKAQVEKLTTQLTDVRLSLDESTATARRLENEATERCQKQVEELRSLEEAHKEEISGIAVEHQTKIEEVLEKHENELQEVIGKEEIKREELVKNQKEEIERLEAEWRAELDKQHDRHLQALEQLNSCHKQQLQDAEMSWRSREKEIEESNAKLMKEQNALKQQAKRLEETLLSDKDHRLQAAKRLCTALQNEVDSLKTVVDMRNSEVHKLRDQLADKEKISEELDAARDRVRALQAKTEDLHAQMEQKLQLERQLMADRHSLSDSLQREASVNKRLSLENEELQWKLRQREASPSNTISTPTIDMVTRCSTGLARQNEGCKTGSVSPQFTPRSQRIGTKPHDKKWSQSFSNIPEDAKRVLRRTDLQHDDIAIESPPPSPRVKGVIEKSNSVSFILDLNDTYQGDSFLGNQSSQVGKKPRTPSMQRKPLAKSFTNCIEKSRSASLVQPSSKSNFFHQEVSNKSSKSKGNDTENENFNGQASIDGESRNGMSLNASKYNRKHSTSESSDSGDIERISPTGLSWTVPVHSNSKRYSKSMTNSRFQLVPETPRLLQQPDEDEYEEPENEFVEVLALSEDLNSAPLTMLFAQTPSTSVSLSDSDVSQCGSRGDLSSEDDEDDEGTLLQKETQCRPQEGAGEAMIFPDVFDLKGNGKKGISKSQISSAPSSDSEDANQTTNEEGALNMSWSEDVECDLTSSSEMQELQLL